MHGRGAEPPTFAQGQPPAIARFILECFWLSINHRNPPCRWIFDHALKVFEASILVHLPTGWNGYSVKNCCGCYETHCNKNYFCDPCYRHLSWFCRHERRFVFRIACVHRLFLRQANRTWELIVLPAHERSSVNKH